jgi:hypothetical protein
MDAVNKIASISLGLSLVCMAATAQATTIHFGTGDGLNTDGMTVLDGTDNNSLVTISTTEKAAFGNSANGTLLDLKYWNEGYGLIGSALYAFNSNSNGVVAEITLTAVSSPVQLASFTFGKFNGLPGSTTWAVYDLGYNLLASGTNTPVPGGLVQPINQVASGFHIQWADDAFNLGVNDIVVNSAPVPLPAAAWLLLSGLAGLRRFARRKGAASLAS